MDGMSLTDPGARVQIRYPRHMLMAENVYFVSRAPNEEHAQQHTAVGDTRIPEELSTAEARTFSFID